MLRFKTFILLINFISTIALSNQHSLENHAIEIIPEHVKQTWRGSYPDTQQRFIIAHNEKQWKQLWHLINQKRKVPNYDNGVGVFIFIGQQLPNNIDIKLLKLKYDNQNQQASLYWEKQTNLNQIGMTAFLDSWVVLLLKENIPYIDKLSHIIEKEKY